TSQRVDVREAIEQGESARDRSVDRIARRIDDPSFILTEVTSVPLRRTGAEAQVGQELCSFLTNRDRIEPQIVLRGAHGRVALECDIDRLLEGDDARRR